MNKIFKKAITVLGSALMVGSTIGLAAAAAYPAPFVQSGAANVAIVYGSDAALSDVVGASNIMGNLATKLAAQTASGSTGSSGTVEGGDSYKFEKASTKFHIGNNFTTITSTLDETELSTLLAEGKFIDDDNDEFDYTQKVEMNASVLSMFEDNDYAEDEPTIGFRIPAGYNVLNYTLEFSDQPLIDDLTTTNLPIMGKQYYVLSNSSSGANLILTLLDSAESKTLVEGITATVSGKEVSISFVSSTETILMVDGVATNSLTEGQTQKLSDGSYVGIKDILYNSKDGGLSSVEFSIGSGKLKLTSGSEVQINDQAISGLSSVMVNASGALGTSTATLTSIELEWEADNDLFITENGSITMPGFEAVKLSFAGVTYPSSEVTEVTQGGDTYAVLDNFPLKDGPADIAFLYGTTAGTFAGIGKDANNKLITSNTTSVTFDQDTDEYFIVSYASTTEGESYLMRATNFVLDSTTNKTDIQYYKDGVWTDKKTGGKAADTFSIGNAELGISFIDRAGKNVLITANNSGTNFFHLYSKEGLRTYLPWSATHANGTYNQSVGSILLGSTNANWTIGHNATAFYLTFSEEDKDGNIGVGDQFNVSVGWDASTTPEVQVSDLIGEDVTAIEIGDSDVWRSFMYSALATEFLWNQPTSGQDSIKIIYHGDEVVADVYITAPETTVTPGTPGSDGTATELGAVTYKDSESASFAGKNLIVVGGSAINSVAADLLGSAARGPAFTTATGVSAGEFLIQSFDRSGKVALLVAGFNAEDTTKAVTYLTNNAVDTTVGTKLKGTSATTATVVTA